MGNMKVIQRKWLNCGLVITRDWDRKVMVTVRILHTGKTNLCINQRIKESVEMMNTGIEILSGMRFNQLLES